MKKGGIVLLILIIFIFSYYVASTFGERENLEVVFLDIGQGDAILVKLENGQNILIDAGEGGSIIKRLTKELGIFDRRIDLLVLTHPHSDHVGGMVEVLKRYEIGTITYTGARHNSPDYIAWLELIRDNNLDLRIVNHPQTIFLDDQTKLEIIYPLLKSDVENAKNLNNTSIVAKLIHGENVFLFTGDIEKEAEEKLIESGVDLSANVLKVAHHASDTSSTYEFIQAVSPSIAVVQLAKNNRFDFPSENVIKRLEDKDIKIYRNDIDSSVHIISDDRGVHLN